MTLPAFSDPQISARIAEWQSPAFDEGTRAEVRALEEAGDAKELEDRFYRKLEFGTGGLRGKRGAGTNRMNETVVGWATQGLANYVAAHAERPAPLKAAIAYDCRHGSPQYARRAASILAANGFTVYLSPELRPTPWLSYAVRQLVCHTGIVVTASHNPKEYNGYKVYWDDGSQVVPPHDAGIIAEVDAINSNAQVKALDYDAAVAQGRIRILGPEMDRDFINAITLQRFDEARCRASKQRIVYTPLHGAGGTIAVKALRHWGFSEVFPVEEQMVVDGDFPTAASPNPEEGAALGRGIALAERLEADLVLATDPDADRLGIAVRHGGAFRLMTGNQLAALMCDWVLGEGARTGKLPDRPGVVTTIVTSPLFGLIAKARGAGFAEVLTGFKWIAQQIRDWDAEDGPRFVYGSEESYGYMIGSHCRDKDGIVASCVVAEMAAAAAAEGLSLFDKLHDLYARHGVRHEWQRNMTFPGKEGAAKIAGILDAIRTSPPKSVGGKPVLRYTRVDTGDILDGQSGARIGRLPLPSSPVFIFDFADGSKAIARPSGTEPKIKFYFFLAEEAAAGMSREGAEAAAARLATEAPAFEAAFLEAIGYTG
ncbi:MAG: phospho-sugar mutase [Candidatus Sumerlaeia bacterium]|nr:phospho-sugar mutase [Candidatus Sumerlaeia bacterium]